MQALRDAAIALNAMERSRARDPSFVDPNLPWRFTSIEGRQTRLWPRLFCEKA
jgi:hypothetical protein